MGAGGVVGHAKVGANPCKCISVTDALLGRIEMEGRKRERLADLANSYSRSRCVADDES